jgi:hypothetical protein
MISSRNMIVNSSYAEDPDRFACRIKEYLFIRSNRQELGKADIA